MFRFYFLLFYFLLRLSRTYLRHRHSLDVVVLEVALEVEDSHLLSLRHLEELAKSRIRVDVLLVVEAVLLHVVHHATRDIGAADLRALGLAKEDAKVVRNLLGLREDRGLLGKGVARLVKGRGPSTAAAAGTLELTGKTLLHLLHVAENHAELVAEVVDLRDLSVELRNKGLRAGLLRGGGNRGRDRYRGGHGNRGRRRGRRRLGGAGRRRGRRYRGGDGCDLLLLGSGRLLRGNTGCLGCSLGAHFILVVGLFCNLF